MSLAELSNYGVINGDRITTKFQLSCVIVCRAGTVLRRVAYSHRKNTGVRLRNTEKNSA